MSNSFVYVLFDPVIHTVAHQVHQRIVQVVYYGLINLGVLALNNQLNVLAKLLLHIANDPVHLLEGAYKGNHSNGHYGVLKLACKLTQFSCRLLEAFKLKSLKLGIGNNHRFRGYYFSYYVVELIQLLQVHADKTLLSAGSAGRLWSRLCFGLLYGRGSFLLNGSRRGSRSRHRLGNRLAFYRSGRRGSLSGCGRGCGRSFLRGLFVSHYFICINVYRLFDKFKSFVNIRLVKGNKETVLLYGGAGIRIVFHIFREPIDNVKGFL